MNNAKFKKISIKRNEGLHFAKISGDNNLIHSCKNTGYQSQFGENIVHGSLAIIKILIKLKVKNFTSLNIKFLSFIKYNEICEIRLIKKKQKQFYYKIYQEQELKITLEIYNFEKEKIEELTKADVEKKITISNNKIKKFHNKFIDANLKLILCELSRYVGVIYPGKYSLINSIDIIKKKNLILKNIIHIKSKKLDKRFNLIENNLVSSQFFVNFKTSIRPKLKKNFKRPNKQIINEIKSIKNNILIIGASSGLGLDLLELVSKNHNIKIISIYKNNKIKLKQKNLISLKIDITSNIKKIFNIIKKYAPLNIYYFATPVINTKVNNEFIFKKYHKYYVSIPLKLVNFSIKHNSNFFYPSTIFINNKDKSHYSILKNAFEKKIRLLKNVKSKINVARIPKLNTRQNLNLFNEKLPNFRDIIFKNREIRKKIFFFN